jgi:hypothetical protein
LTAPIRPTKGKPMNPKLTAALKRAAVLSWQEIGGTSPRRKAMNAREGAKIDAWIERQHRATELIASGQATRKTAMTMVKAQDRVATR